MAVFCTFGLVFFVCLEIVWNGVKDNFVKKPKVYEYVVRTALVVAAVGLAIAVPTIGPFIGLIGAFAFSLLGLIFPILIEIVTYWDVGFGAGNWRIWKNILVLIFGVLALIFGSQTSIADIIKAYSPDPVQVLDINSIVNSTVANVTEAVTAVASNFTAAAQ